MQIMPYLKMSLLVTSLVSVVPAPAFADIQAIGWIEHVKVSTANLVFNAKIDTGADNSSIVRHPPQSAFLPHPEAPETLLRGGTYRLGRHQLLESRKNAWCHYLFPKCSCCFLPRHITIMFVYQETK